MSSLKMPEEVYTWLEAWFGKSNEGSVVGSLLALCLPLLISQLLTGNGGESLISTSCSKGYTCLKTWITSRRREVSRVIENETCFDHWGYEIRDDKGGDTDRNQILIKALKLYIATHCKTQVEKAESAHCVLLPKEIATTNKDYDSEDDDDDNEDSNNEDNISASKELNKLCIETVPAPETWTVVKRDNTKNKYEINIFISRTLAKSGTSNDEQQFKQQQQRTKIITRYEISARGNNGAKRTDDFIDEAYQWYIKEIKVSETTCRYMYSPISNSGTSQWRRYALTDEKTFDTLWFPAKHTLLHILNSFITKSGKFAVDSFPYKLGLLLWGPPGSGKTSIIKAIAEKTKRHIVSLPLKRIQTNTQLMAAIYDCAFQVPGTDDTVRLSFDQIIFVMEDIDAASSVVLKRDADQDKNHVTAPQLTRHGSRCSDQVQYAEHHTEPIALTRNGSNFDHPKNPTNTKDTNHNKNIDDNNKNFNIDSNFSSMLKAKQAPNDALNLAGILNALDGIVDSPGRIVIMTSNHPERLDSALLRPGRINLKLYLGFLEIQDAVDMASHYFNANYISPADSETKITHLEALRQAFHDLHSNGHQLTPAQLEHLCSEYSALPELTAGILRMAATVPLVAPPAQSFCSSSPSSSPASLAATDDLNDL